MPVDLALNDDPPLVVLVVVRIVGRTRRMQDHIRLHIVGHDEQTAPRAVLRGMARQELIQPGMQVRGAENCGLNDHNAAESTPHNWRAMDHRGRIVLADNLAVLAETPDDSIDLIYVDPPFNTGQRQTLTSIRSVRDEAQGDRQGFQGRRYRTLQLGTSSY